MTQTNLPIIKATSIEQIAGMKARDERTVIVIHDGKELVYWGKIRGSYVFIHRADEEDITELFVQSPYFSGAEIRFGNVSNRRHIRAESSERLGKNEAYRYKVYDEKLRRAGQ